MLFLLILFLYLAERISRFTLLIIDNLRRKLTIYANHDSIGR